MFAVIVGVCVGVNVVESLHVVYICGFVVWLRFYYSVSLCSASMPSLVPKPLPCGTRLHSNGVACMHNYCGSHVFVV